MKSVIFTVALGTALFLTGCSSKKIEVPAVTGLDVATATLQLEAKGFTIVHAPAELGGPEIPPGSVLRQHPPAGQTARRGSAIQLTVDDSLFLPNYVGLDLAAAQGQAQSQRVQVARLEKRFTGKSAFNSVVAQMPPPNTRLLANSAVVLTVEDHVVMPNLLGLAPEQARVELEQIGLRLGASAPAKAAAGAVVVQHNPEAGHAIAPGAAVDLTLGNATALNTEKTDSAIGRGKDSIDNTLTTVNEGVRVIENMTETVDLVRGLFGGKKKKEHTASGTPPAEVQEPGRQPRSAGSTLSAIHLSPRAPATLSERQSVRVTFRYTTDESQGVVIAAIPQRAGQPLSRVAGTASRTFRAKAGEGSLEIAIPPPGATADELRLEMRSAPDRTRLLCEMRVPFQYQFGNQPRTAPTNDPIVPGKVRGFPLADELKRRGIRVP